MADKISTLKNLEKIAHQKVERVQKELVQVLSAMDTLAHKVVALKDQIAHEASSLGDDVHMLTYFDRFEKRTKNEIKKIEGEIQTLRQHEAHLRSELAENYAEEKRYKILLDRKIEQQKKEQAKKNQVQLDEIASTRATHQDHNDKG